MQASAYRSLASPSHASSSGGPYCVNIVITQRSSSVSPPSIADGSSASTYGSAAGLPIGQSCQARSR